MKQKGVVIIVVILALLFLVNCFSCGSCGGGNDGGGKDGGRCQVCGTHTNYTYKAGGYLCYSCNKKYYK